MKKIVLFMFLLAAVACTKTDDLEMDYGLDKNHAVMTRSGASEAITEVISDNTESEIALSEPLDNPYSVVTMQTAYNSLPAATRALAPNLTITTTHRYVKIPVISEAVLDALSQISKRDNLEFSDYPMDRDIVSGGVPIEQEGVARFLYASLPVTYSLPDTINYEQIENLYIPDENLESEESDGPTTRAGGVLLPKDFVIALVNKAMVMTNNEDYCYVPNTDPQTRAWRPAGRIEVWDDVKNGLIPLEGAKVRCRRWFTYHRGITNADGYYSCDGTYKRPGNYSIVWERAYWDIRSGTFGQALYNGPKIKGNWNLQIRGGNSINYATCHRALMRWFYGDIEGMKRPGWKRSIKIKVVDEKSGSTLGSFSQWGQSTLGIGPDVIMYCKDQSTSQVFSTMAHEIGHAAHYKNSGYFTYWMGSTKKYMKESWASFCGWYLTKLEYEALGVWDAVSPPNRNLSYVIGWYYNGPAWGSKKHPIYAWGERADTYNRGYWASNSSAYTPLFIGLMARTNFKAVYGEDRSDDDIRGVPATVIQQIMYTSDSPQKVFSRFYELVGQTYEEQTITENMVDRYLEVYKRQ